MGKTTKAMKPGTVYTNNCIRSLYNLVSRSSSKESKGHMLASHNERIHFKQVTIIIWFEQILNESLCRYDTGWHVVVYIQMKFYYHCRLLMIA